MIQTKMFLIFFSMCVCMKTENIKWLKLSVMWTAFFKVSRLALNSGVLKDVVTTATAYSTVYARAKKEASDYGVNM